MLEQLKKEVYEANMLLPAYRLITFTWGNVSGFDPESRLFVFLFVFFPVIPNKRPTQKRT